MAGKYCAPGEKKGSGKPPKGMKPPPAPKPKGGKK
jgi:hypothetical protein